MNHSNDNSEHAGARYRLTPESLDSVAKALTSKYHENTRKVRYSREPKSSVRFREGKVSRSLAVAHWLTSVARMPDNFTGQVREELEAASVDVEATWEELSALLVEGYPKTLRSIARRFKSTIFDLPVDAPTDHIYRGKLVRYLEKHGHQFVSDVVDEFRERYQRFDDLLELVEFIRDNWEDWHAGVHLPTKGLSRAEATDIIAAYILDDIYEFVEVGDSYGYYDKEEAELEALG